MRFGARKNPAVPDYRPWTVHRASGPFSTPGRTLYGYTSFLGTPPVSPRDYSSCGFMVNGDSRSPLLLKQWQLFKASPMLTSLSFSPADGICLLLCYLRWGWDEGGFPLPTKATVCPGAPSMGPCWCRDHGTLSNTGFCHDTSGTAFQI